MLSRQEKNFGFQAGSASNRGTKYVPRAKRKGMKHAIATYAIRKRTDRIFEADRAQVVNAASNNRLQGALFEFERSE